MNATFTYECPRCCGQGNIPAFGHVLGGVCFSCGGSGKKSGKAKKENKFSAINAMRCETLEEAQVYRLEVFGERFPELVAALELTENAEIRRCIANGMGQLKTHVANLA